MTRDAMLAELETAVRAQDTRAAKTAFENLAESYPLTAAELMLRCVTEN